MANLGTPYTVGCTIISVGRQLSCVATMSYPSENEQTNEIIMVTRLRFLSVFFNVTSLRLQFSLIRFQYLIQVIFGEVFSSKEPKHM